MNRIRFWIRRRLKHCWSCGLKIVFAWETKDSHGFATKLSNGGTAYIVAIKRWGYVCIPCMIESFKIVHDGGITYEND